jgi:catechol-2,3-dioxygenase
MTKPIRFSHAVLKTYDVASLRKWYCNALDAHVVFEKLPLYSFITYDEEHHRLGIIAMTGKPTPIEPRAPGLLHLAFTFRNIGELLDLYQRLQESGEKPDFTVNHGPTISFYYSDPDGNGVEFQVDRYASAAEAQDFIDKVFDKNPVGVACDPEELLERRRAGETDEQLMCYDLDAPMVLPPYAELEHHS